MFEIILSGFVVVCVGFIGLYFTFFLITERTQAVPFKTGACWEKTGCQQLAASHVILIFSAAVRATGYDRLCESYWPPRTATEGAIR